MKKNLESRVNNTYPAFFNYSASFNNSSKDNKTIIPLIEKRNIKYSPYFQELMTINPQIPIQIEILPNKPKITKFDIISDFRHNKTERGRFYLLKDTELIFEYDSVDFDAGDIPKYTIIDKDGNKIGENLTDKRFSYNLSEPGEHLFALEVIDMQGNRDFKVNDTIFFVENISPIDYNISFPHFILFILIAIILSYLDIIVKDKGKIMKYGFSSIIIIILIGVSLFWRDIEGSDYFSYIYLHQWGTLFVACFISIQFIEALGKNKYYTQNLLILLSLFSISLLLAFDSSIKFLLDYNLDIKVELVLHGIFIILMAIFFYFSKILEHQSTLCEDDQPQQGIVADSSINEGNPLSSDKKTHFMYVSHFFGFMPILVLLIAVTISIHRYLLFIMMPVRIHPAIYLFIDFIFGVLIIIIFFIPIISKDELSKLIDLTKFSR
jgi:hypothetical protein